MSKKEAFKEDSEDQLSKIAWMLSGSLPEIREESDSYGDLTHLNTDGLILRSVGKENLREIAMDYLSMLETSAAIYEKNGDYACGIFSSKWCSMMDCASRKLCNTDDNRKALDSGKWLCHESCWTDCALNVIKAGDPVEIECAGGIHMYGVPIYANGNIIGAMNFGYGDPPKEEEKQKELAKSYGINIEELKEVAEEYQSRPKFIIDLARQRLQQSARVIGLIVEQKIAKERIEENQKELKMAQNVAHIGNWKYDIENQELTWSDELYRIYGIDPEKEVASLEHAIGMIHPEDIEYAQDTFSRASSKGEQYEMIYRIIRKDGSIRYIHAKGMVVLDDEGKVRSVHGIGQDVTELKITELAMKESEEKYRNLVETASDAIYMISDEGKILDTNKCACDMLGRTKEEILELEIGDIDPNFPTQEFVDFWRDTPYDEQRIFETTHITKEGELIPVEVSGKKYILNDKTFFYGIARNISQRRSDESRLRESEERFRTIYEKSPIGIALFNDQKQIFKANTEFCNMLGYSEKEIIDIGLGRISHTDDLEKDIDHFHDAEREGIDNYRIEKRYVDKEGKIVWGDLTVTIIRNEKGKINFGIGMVVDITERKMTEKSLIDSEKQFRTITESAPDAIFIVDELGNYTYVNEESSKLTGYSIDELLNMNIRDIGKQDIKGRRFQNLIKEGKLIAEMELKRKDGSYVTVDLNAVRLPNGLFYGSCRDLTERKKWERELKDSEKRFRTMIEKGSDVIYLINKKGEIEFLSSSYDRIFKIPKVELMNKPVADFIIDKLHPDDIQDIMEKFSEMLTGDVPEIEVGCRYMDPSGEYRHLDIRAQNRFDDPAVQGLVLNVRDITDKKKVEIDHLKEKERAEFYLDLLGHDLGNIHQGIGGALDIMKNNLGDEKKLKTLLGISSKSIKNSMNLTKEVMMLSRIMNQEPELETVDLGQIINKSIVEVLRAFPEKHPRITVYNDIDTIKADHLIKEIFMNLLHNSIRLQDKFPVVDIRSRKEKGSIVIEISDEGPGIPDDLKPDLFKRYGIRGERSRTGLGLSIVNALVDRYGGVIHVKDRVQGDHKQGACFVITIPDN